MISLTPRLHKVASLVPKNSILADVGTDHAYVPVYCIQNGICQRAIAMDINEGPIKNAWETVSKNGVCDKVELRLSDGLKELAFGEADAVVIAGMGGLLIQKILEDTPLKEGTLLILQPMLAAKELRKYLFSKSMAIEDEYLAMEGKKIYNIIVARVGRVDTFLAEDILIGRNVFRNSPELFSYYRAKEIGVRGKILNGLLNAGKKDKEAIDTVSLELAVWEGANYED